MVAIDGSKFKAVNNRDKNFTPHKLKARMQQLEESIARYLNDLDRADRDPTSVPAARVAHLKEKIATVKAQMRKLRRIEQQMQQTPDEQISLTDPDARSMATSGRGSGVVGYNVQAAVDTEHHLMWRTRSPTSVTTGPTDRDGEIGARSHRCEKSSRRWPIVVTRRRGDPQVRPRGINALVPKPILQIA